MEQLDRQVRDACDLSCHEIGLLAPTVDPQPVLALRPEYRHHGDNALQPVAVFQLTAILLARSRRFSRHDQPVIVGPMSLRTVPEPKRDGSQRPAANDRSPVR